jgi:hypothetical protein
MVTGIAFTVAGGMGAAFFLLGYMPIGNCSPHDHCEGNSTMMIGGGIGALVGFGVGIPLILYGKERVPANSYRSASDVGAPLRLTMYPGGLSLSGNF